MEWNTVRMCFFEEGEKKCTNIRKCFMRQYRGWPDLQQCGWTAVRNRKQQMDCDWHHSEVLVRGLKISVVLVDAIKTAGDCRNRSSHFNLCTKWRWVVRFTHRQPYFGRNIPSTHWAAEWVGPNKTGLGAPEEGKSLIVARDRNTNSRLSRKNCYGEWLGKSWAKI